MRTVPNKSMEPTGGSRDAQVLAERQNLVSCRQNKWLLARGLRKMEAGFEGLAAIFDTFFWL